MPWVVALWGKNSFTPASCDGRAPGSTADTLQPLDQPLARGEHLGLAAGEQVALERAAGVAEPLPDPFPASIVERGRRHGEAEAGRVEHQQLVADQSRGPASRARRRLERREQALEPFEEPQIRLAFRQGGGGQRAGPCEAGGGERLGEQEGAAVDQLDAEMGELLL